MRGFLWYILLYYALLHSICVSAIKIIRHSTTSITIQQDETRLLFCEADEEFETCSWIIRNENSGTDCNGCKISFLDINERHGKKCNDCMDNVSWNITSKRCGIQIIQASSFHQGAYQCVLRGFGETIRDTRIRDRDVIIQVNIDEKGWIEFIMEHLYTYIIPGIVISLMLILAIALACVLRRKQRQGKLNLFYSESFEKPREPVILEDELTSSDREVLFQHTRFSPKDKVEPISSDYSKNVHERSNMNLDHIASPEMDELLKLDQAPIHIDPDSFNCNSRPSPVYKKKQVL